MAGFPKKTGHVKIAAFLMGLFLPAAGAATVFAAETADLDLTRSGSVGLTLTDVEGKTVSGGSVTLYEVAKLYLDDGDMAYEYTEAFSECTVTLDVTDLTMAEALVGYLAEYPADGEEKAIGGDGKISFTDLEPGLYLLVQTNESDGFERFNPFVVTVPIDMDGEWVYTVDASPKVGPVTPEETESPTEGSTEPSTEGNTEPSTERSTEPSTE
ncbi:MAG: hypothetical protein LUI14_08900, partial [Lachnospiraceae bacterium]|nr:hypothetical protein [Lachnospiraceae bacterium]